jgi:hypothetical protein
MTPDDAPNLNTGTPWSEIDLYDLAWAVRHGRSIEETADYLCRSITEVRTKAAELGLAFKDSKSHD